GAGADYGVVLAGKAVCKTDARSDVIPICRESPLRRAVHTRESNHARSSRHRIDRQRIKGILLVADYLTRELDVVADAGVDGQAIRDAPVVLKVNRAVRSPRRDLIGHLNVRRVRIAQKEAGEGISAGV